MTGPLALCVNDSLDLDSQAGGLGYANDQAFGPPGATGESRTRHIRRVLHSVNVKKQNQFVQPVGGIRRRADDEVFPQCRTNRVLVILEVKRPEVERVRQRDAWVVQVVVFQLQANLGSAAPGGVIDELQKDLHGSGRDTVLARKPRLSQLVRPRHNQPAGVTVTAVKGSGLTVVRLENHANFLTLPGPR